MCDFKIAIPSLGRSDCIGDLLYFLESYNIPNKNIYIFVIEEEYQAYKDACNMNPNEEYVKNWDDYNIIIGRRGIVNNRNFITRFFPEATYLICIDDDVIFLNTWSSNLKCGGTCSICGMEPYGLYPFKCGYYSFTSLVEYAYNKLIESDLYIWGTYPVNNQYYLEKQKELTWGLKFLLGSVFGFIVRHDHDLILNQLAEGKEDIEQSILFYKKDGGVLRFNRIACEKQKNIEGGLGKGQTRIDINNKASEYMIATYPDYITSSFTRKNGSIEHRLKKKPKHDFKRRDVILTLCDYVYENGKFGQSSQEMLLSRDDIMQKLLKYFV